MGSVWTGGFTLVVRCSDPRLDRFFDRPELRARMGLNPSRQELSEAYIANVGGLLSLTGAEAPRLIHDTGLLIKLFGGSDDRVVLTAHSTCGGYLDAVEGSTDAVMHRQTEDMRATAHRISAALPLVTVDAYYIDLERGTANPINLD